MNEIKKKKRAREKERMKERNYENQNKETKINAKKDEHTKIYIKRQGKFKLSR